MRCTYGWVNGTAWSALVTVSGRVPVAAVKGYHTLYLFTYLDDWGHRWFTAQDEDRGCWYHFPYTGTRMADWLLRERLRLCSMLDVMQFSPVYARSLATSLGVSMGCISWVYLCGVYPGYMYGVYILGICMGYISWVYLWGIYPGYI